MNRFVQQFAQDGHLTFNQKCRGFVMQIFGHEGLIDDIELRRTIKHCGAFKEDIYYLTSLKLRHLALRKLLNPFKWGEFFIAAIPTFLTWALQRHAALLMTHLDNSNDFSGKSLGMLYGLIATGLSFIVNAAIYSALAIPKAMLAPTRYLIRPTINLAKSQPHALLTLISLTAMTVTAISISVMTAGLPIIMASIVMTTTVVSAWPFYLKLWTTLQDIVGAWKQTATPVHYQDKSVKLQEYTTNSTRGITIALHGLNPVLTEINSPKDQHLGQTLALLTGTEALFYPPNPKQNIIPSSYRNPRMILVPDSPNLRLDQ